MARSLQFVLVGIDKLSKTVKAAGGNLEKLQGQMEKFTGVAEKVGIGGAVAFGAGFANALDVSAGRAKLQAQLGLTGKDAKKVGDVAGKVYANAFGDSLDQVNDAVKSVVQNMSGMAKASAGDLQKVTEGALTLASVLGEDVNKVTSATSTLLKTGLAKTAKEAFDVIARGAQLGANKQEDLLDTLIEYPTQFRKLGLSAQTATGLLTQGLQAGARDADTVADALKEFSIRAVDGSKLTAEGFGMVGLNADVMASKIAKGGKSASAGLALTLDKLRAIKDPVKQGQAAVALFGTKAEDLGAALFALDPTSAAKKLSNLAGTTDRASKVMGDTAAGRIETFKRSLISAFTDTIGNNVLPWIAKLQDKLANIGITPTTFVAIGGALLAVAVAVKAVSLALGAYNAIVTIVSGVTKVWAGVQWLLNAAMSANPLTIIILAIMALVAAVIIAYQKSDTFRKIVQAAWEGIKASVAFAWEKVIKPAFQALVKFYENVLAPAVMWFWNKVIKPAWTAISFAVQVAWGIIKIIFAAFKLYLEKVLAPIVLWVWRNIIKPTWDAIAAGISRAWNNSIKPAWELMKKAMGLVGDAMKSVWNNAIKPTWNAIKTGIDQVAKAFSSAKDFIGRVWSKVADLAAKPVRFVLETVYTKGIKGVWDKVADFVHADHLPAAPKFATGGKITQGTGPKADDVLIKASRNEYVVNAASVSRNLPLIDFINRRGKNKSIMKDLGLAGDPGGVLPGFADGGIVGWVKSFANKAKNGFLDGAANATQAVFNPIRSLIDHTLGTSGIGGTIGGVPKRYMDDLYLWILSHKSALEGGSGAKAVQAARSQIGVPYSWGGGGPNGPSYGIQQGANIRGFDCSSLMQYGWYKSVGKVMPRTTYTQWPWLDKVSDIRPGDMGFPHAGHVFMYAGNNRIVEAPYTGANVRETSIRPARWGRPPASFMRADNGLAMLSPGMNHVYNGTGAPEPLVNPLMHGAGGVVIKEIHNHFADDRNMYEKGKHFAEGIGAYTKRAGNGWAKNAGLLPKGS